MVAGSRRRILALALALASVNFGSTAWGDVISIGRDGAVTVYDRPAIVTSEGVTPIERAAPAPDGLAGSVEAGRRAPAPVARALDRAGGRVELSPLLLEAIAWAESRFNTQARSHRGAQGVMQLMPGTAAEMGVDPADPEANVVGGARYLRRMMEEFDGNLELAIAAYNAGPAAVRRYNGVPPFKETRAYVAAVMGYMAARADEEHQH